MIRLRAMEVGDLATVARWLAEPHVSRWYVAGSSVEREIEDLRRSAAGEQAVHALMVSHGGVAVGWCQWYLCHDDPEWAKDIGAEPGDVGIDYAIGSPAHQNQGIGTKVIAELVNAVRAVHPGASILADPDEQNKASRRVLEKNGFQLVAVKRIPSEPTDEPMAIYRLSPGASVNASERSIRDRSR